MGPEPIFVDSEEELPAVIERIKQAGSEDVPLVLPVHSRIGRSRFSFQLLRRYARQLGKRVSVVSPDGGVQQMAQEAGFRSAGSLESLVQSPPQVAGFPAREPVAPLPEPPRAWPTGPPQPMDAVNGGPAQGVLPLAGPTGSRIRVAPPGVVRTGPQPSRLVLYSAIALVLTVALIGLLVFVPSAKVTLVAQAQPFTADFTVTAAPTGAPVHVRAATAGKKVTQSFKATGVKTIPGRPAVGGVVFDANSCHLPFGIEIRVPNGTRLRSSTGVQFATTGGDVTIQPDQGAATTITATSSGQNGNLPANTLFVVENAGNTGGCLVARGGPTSGGQDEVKKTVLSQSDFDNARSQLNPLLQSQLTNDLRATTQKGEKLNDEIQFRDAQLSTDHKVGDEVQTFNATMDLQAEGDYYRPDDVTGAFVGLLAQKVPAGRQLAGQSTASYQASAAAGGHLTFSGKASGFSAPKIDRSAVSANVTAKSVAQAEQNLKQLPIQSVVIEQHPFRLPFMPLSSSRIEVEYDVTVVPPGPAPK